MKNNLEFAENLPVEDIEEIKKIKQTAVERTVPKTRSHSSKK